MASIFVSYTRSDQSAALTLADDLKALGHEPWLDQALSGGQVWWNQILAAIRRADVFCVAVSPGSLDSVACKRELAYAISLNRAILPVLVQDVTIPLLPPALAERQLVDYRRVDRDGLRSLAKALTSLPPAGALPDPLPPEPAIPVSYLSSLRDQVETTGILSFEDQSGIVLRLKGGLEGADRAHAEALLAKLRSRRDLYAQVGDEIDGLIKQPQAPKAGKPRPEPPKPAPKPVTGVAPESGPPSPIPTILSSLLVAAMVTLGVHSPSIPLTTAATWFAPLVAVTVLLDSFFWARSRTIGLRWRVGSIVLPLVIGFVAAIQNNSRSDGRFVWLGLVTVAFVSSLGLTLIPISTGRRALVVGILGTLVGVVLIFSGTAYLLIRLNALTAIAWIILAATMVVRWRAAARKAVDLG